MDRMIHEPEIVNFLLYPFQPGKKYSYKGTVRETNVVCHRISLSTKEGFLIDYYIDVESYCITSVKIVDELKEFNPVTIKYSDYRLIDGVFFAHKIVYFVDGKWDSTLNINKIIINSGAVNWMFYSK